MDTHIVTMDVSFATMATHIVTMDVYFATMDTALLPMDVSIAENYVSIGPMDVSILEKCVSIGEKYASIATKDASFATMDVSIAEKYVSIAPKCVSIAPKDVSIGEKYVSIATMCVSIEPMRTSKELMDASVLWMGLSIAGKSASIETTDASTLLVADPKEGEDIPVGIGDLESPQALVDERQFLHERHTPLAELVEKRVGVQSVDVRIPTSPFVSAAVWTWKHVGKDGLEHDADSVSAHSAVVRVLVWTLEVKLEAEALDVVGDRSLQILHDEERIDRNEISTRPFGVWAL
jgi:hypothetical protein